MDEFLFDLDLYDRKCLNEPLMIPGE